LFIFFNVAQKAPPKMHVRWETQYSIKAKARRPHLQRENRRKKKVEPRPQAISDLRIAKQGKKGKRGTSTKR